MELPNLPLVNLAKELLSSDAGRTALSNNNFLPLTSPVPLKLRPAITEGEIVEVLQLLCAGAGVACPIIDTLPTT
jgi:hypothetical protein